MGSSQYNPKPPKHEDPKHDDPTQAQGQAELQAQLQAQGQGQGQGQGQSQGQSQYAGQYAGQAVETDVWNANGNLNGNANGNFNANGNLNGNVNYNDNYLSNEVENKVDNCVNVEVKVDLDLEGTLATPADSDAIDIDSICGVEESIIMPDVVNQTVDCGNNFNIDQVNNLTDNDTLNNPTVSYTAGGLADSCCDPCWGADANSVGDFTMTATATGGTASTSIGALTGDDGDFSGAGAATAAVSLTQEAFTQSIVQGANIQFNSIELTVGSGDALDSL